MYRRVAPETGALSNPWSFPIPATARSQSRSAIRRASSRRFSAGPHSHRHFPPAVHPIPVASSAVRLITLRFHPPSIHIAGETHEPGTRPRRHPQRRIHPHLRRQARRSGRSAARTSPAGRSTTSKARPPIPIASTPRSPAAGSARSSSARTTAAKPGSPSATIRLRRRRPARIMWYDGTPHPWEFKRVWHLEPSLTDPDTVYAGVEDAAIFRVHRRRPDLARSFPACASTAPATAGSRARAACACTPSSSTPAIPSASSSPSPPPAPFAPTTAARPGSPSTAASARTTSPTPTPRSATASTTSPCTRRARRALHAEALGRHAHRRRGR